MLLTYIHQRKNNM